MHFRSYIDSAKKLGQKFDLVIDDGRARVGVSLTRQEFVKRILALHCNTRYHTFKSQRKYGYIKSRKNDGYVNRFSFYLRWQRPRCNCSHQMASKPKFSFDEGFSDLLKLRSSLHMTYVGHKAVPIDHVDVWIFCCCKNWL